MREQAEQPRARPGRCANHPDVAEIGRCSICDRPLCLVCAVAFRERVVGPECLHLVLEDAPPQAPPAAPRFARGDLLAAIGFGLAVALTAFPWSRFGEDSGAFGAWSLHWSLTAAVAALVGLGLALRAWFRPGRPRVEAALLGALALVLGAGALIEYLHPPPLSEHTVAPLLVAGGAAIALAGAFWKAGAVLMAGRPVR